MSRRALLLFGLTIAATVPIVRAQRQEAPLRIEKVTDNLYVITGGRGTGGSASTVSGNTTVFVGDGGVVLIDTKLPGFGAGILEQVRSVTNKPVATIINTHTHADHTGGNPELPRNVEHVAHENTKTNMAKMSLFEGANASLLPGKTFSDRLTLQNGSARIDLYYFGRGHTNGDAVIVFPSLRTAVMGDLFARKWAPNIDAGNGGSAVEYPDTLAKAVAGLAAIDTIITGHATTPIGRAGTFSAFSPVARPADLQEYAEFVREFVAAARRAKAAGKTVDAAVSDLKLPDRYRAYDMTRARDDVQLVYDETP